ncbi:MAG: hypothetical protein ACFFAO_00115 [Candidatus Hermodarchaeota archaeon]
MMLRKKKIFLLSLLSTSILFVLLMNNINISYAQNEVETLDIPQNFTINEFSENNGTIVNETSIDIDLGSSRWNVTGIELNFTDIKQEHEIKTIEDTVDGDKYLIKNDNKAFGVQLNITEKTILYGVYIYGYIGIVDLISDVYVQINGYDNGEPTSAVYGEPVKLNMSYNIVDWYYQNFTDSITLEEGQYYLVINATKYLPADNSRIYWFYSSTNANNPNLNISTYKTGIWTRVQGEPFLHKLHQKINKTYYPEEVAMKANINGNLQPILDRTNAGEGILTNDTINFPLMESHLSIPIQSNYSILFNFTLNYRINLENDFFTDGSVTIYSKIDINWTVDFTLDRTDGNYSVQFIAPNSWENFTVLKNGISSSFDESGNVITIFNDTIPDLSIPWEITAQSPDIPVSTSTINSGYSAGEEISFEVLSPKDGNYTFVLYQTGGVEKNRNVTVYTGSGSIIYSYILPLSATNGDWEIYIYWNNETDAGVEFQSFTVSGGSSPPIVSGGGGGGGDGSTTVVTGLDPFLVLIISILIVAGVVGGLTSYQMVKRVKKKRDLFYKKLYNKFVDILSLNYLMITNKVSGLNVYEQFFAGKVIDPALISGFLEAIRNFGIELTGTYTQSQTVKLEYQDSKILMNEFKAFRIILVMTQNPSEDFISSIVNLSYEIEQRHGEAIRNFMGGNTEIFRDINQIIEKHLNTSFIYPLKVEELPGTKLNSTETSMVNKAKVIMKQNNLGYFFTTFLMPDQKYDPKKTKAIFSLIDKKIFVPTKL